jgi:uncharacterized protein YjiS (DUF1127 family)
MLMRLHLASSSASTALCVGSKQESIVIPVGLAAVTFAACNSARVLAYIPQIVRIAHDQNGSPGVSCLTWAGFATANFSTVAYALVTSAWIMAAVFGVNAVFCLAIVTLTAWRRFQSGGDATGVIEAVATDSGRGAHLLARAEERTKKTVSSFLRDLQAWWRYETTVRELWNLSDRELADLGITRKDIARVASQALQSDDRAKYRVR